MKLKKIAKLLSATVVFMPADGEEKDINGFYCGDLLSRVMVKAPSGCGWLTIIDNINVAGVAVFAGIPLVILCEGIIPQSALIQRLGQEGIALLQTDLTAFDCCIRLGQKEC